MASALARLAAASDCSRDASPAGTAVPVKDALRQFTLAGRVPVVAVTYPLLTFVRPRWH